MDKKNWIKQVIRDIWEEACESHSEMIRRDIKNHIYGKKRFEHGTLEHKLEMANNNLDQIKRSLQVIEGSYFSHISNDNYQKNYRKKNGKRSQVN